MSEIDMVLCVLSFVPAIVFCVVAMFVHIPNEMDDFREMTFKP